MGIISTLIGNYARTRAQEGLQKAKDINDQIADYRTLMSLPGVNPVKVQEYGNKIQDLIEKHGGPAGKQHAAGIRGLLTTLAGTMGEAVGRPRPQAPFVPATPTSSAPVIMTPEQQAAERKRLAEEGIGTDVERATKLGDVAQAQEETRKKKAVAWFDDPVNRAALKRVGYSDRDIEDMKVQEMAPSGTKLREPKRTPVIIMDPQGRPHEWSIDDRGQYYNENNIPMTVPPDWSPPTKIGTARTGAAGGDLAAALKPLVQSYQTQGYSFEEAKKLAGAKYLAGVEAGLQNKEMTAAVNQALAQMSGIEIPSRAPAAPPAAPPGAPPAAPSRAPAAAPAAPKLAPLPPKGTPVTSPTDAAAMNEFIFRTLNPMAVGRDKFTSYRMQRGQAILMQQTGMTSEQLNAAVKLKAGQADALNSIVQRASGVRTLQDQLAEFGNVLIEARDKVDDTGVSVLNRWLQAGKRSIKGDEAVSRLDAAVNALTRTYAQLLSGGYTGTAMPHVSSADDAKETIAAEMTKGTIKGVIDQMKIEAMREGQVYAKRQREAFDILATPLGQFGPGGPDSGAGAGRPSTAADYLKKIGHQ